jgi:membrane-bound lytic murein transglycosylase B
MARRVRRFSSRAVSALIASALLTGCAGTPSAMPGMQAPGATANAAGASPAVPASATVPAEARHPADFAEWLAGLRAEALAAGISAATLDRALAGLRPMPEVLAADAAQPEFTRQVWAYLDGTVTPARVARGRELLDLHAPLFAEVEERYGVPPGIIAGIWAMESNFGSNIGSTPILRALATLGYEGRRTRYGREQILAALAILDRGDVPADRMIGSWAGAMGQTQFIPTTYVRFAVDADADGRRDLWSSLPDIFASTANYLASSGWRSGLPWGMEVGLPAGFDHALADPSIERPVGEWAELGVRPLAGGLPPSAEPASVLLPAGHRGPAFLVTGNFKAILRYNNSTSYALAVSQLADRFGGAGPVMAAWPREERALSRDERTEMQRLLAARGYDVGTPDGIVGPMTRTALRSFQRDQGLPADGFPTAGLLDRLRAAIRPS